MDARMYELQYFINLNISHKNRQTIENLGENEKLKVKSCI